MAQGIIGVRLEPFHRAYPALISQGMGVGMAQVPLQALQDQGDAGLNFALVWIASFLHIALGHPMGTEKDVGASRIGSDPDLAADQASHGSDIAGVVVPTANAAKRQPVEGRVGLAQPLQLTKTGAAGADRELGIEG